ncbi:MAG: response regulator transcription factor [Roseburia sp.]|nr:response regulator transcription factor [Roseburia sp.]MCM1242253.1 response regulator transcription factor [Roseburia sp.]
MKHILIVEDDAGNNQMIREYLENHGYQCTQAFSGSEGKLLFSMNEYDLVLLDLMLPGISGEELVSVFTKRTPVIVLSAKSSLESKVGVLSSGADDYICKPFELPELLVRIQVQLRRRDSRTESMEPAGVAYRYKEWTLNPDTQEMAAGGQMIDLTKHEFLILELFIRNPKRVFSKQMIYEYAWGEEYLAEDKTINVHISNIRAKLKDSGTDGYIQTVWGLGFKLV